MCKGKILDVMQHGIAPFIVQEACGDRYQAVNEANLFDMDQKFAEIVIEEWMMKHFRKGIITET